MDNFSWEKHFLTAFKSGIDKYRSGNRDPDKFFSDEELKYFNSIGYKHREFFDFVEDYCDTGAPSIETAILIAAARRDYFYTIQKKKISSTEVTPTDLPSRDSKLGDIPWLPRIITKARAKLRGELHPDIMYSCQGDMNFLRSHNIHPADFLRVVWASGEDDDKILSYIKNI
ncbi:MAG: DUF5069 domain-containing protein [Verrucomicrobiota bacterium]|jgi:hypothetical protein|nr:DUF5069 domain-containing protein [Verrucomicrobiales bacterium]MEC9037164.1 DUF5069 domain-containing protein [Verrucomicrobiota bacterium]MED5457619.1 DUF5069 domain-containing protein [Verrucomicrobiota bacterium]MEE2968428.1 DUF5069 domain-containing protein [Verrucomicrobiota bacterium]HAA88517.1 hypothetical protein [Verrucomicrobiales bacterium]|tara:strand:- start:515 stop:1030 length:516 start_codon:yes stop_codon:yes gene_type:complete